MIVQTTDGQPKQRRTERERERDSSTEQHLGFRIKEKSDARGKKLLNGCMHKKEKKRLEVDKDKGKVNKTLQIHRQTTPFFFRSVGSGSGYK